MSCHSTTKTMLSGTIAHIATLMIQHAAIKNRKLTEPFGGVFTVGMSITALHYQLLSY